jgi:hypothetical protein
MKNITTLLIALAYIGLPGTLAAQKGGKTDRVLSYWNIRINPLSVMEKWGGVLAGIETNVDKKRKLYLVSEYGVIFINDLLSRQNKNSREPLNKQPLSGLKTKQELRWLIKGKKEMPVGFIALETTLQQASTRNSGWFGIGDKDLNGSYTYYKYQQFQEQVSVTSAA